MKTVGILALTEPHFGGVYQYTQSLIDALVQDPPFRVVIFTREPERYSDLPVEVRTGAFHPNEWFRRLGTIAGLLHVNLQAAVPQNERALFEDIDLFIAPALSLYPHYFLGKPYLFTLHDLQEHHFPEYFSWRMRLYRFLHNLACSKWARGILCESEYVKSDIVRFLGASPDKIHVLPAPPSSEFLGVAVGESDKQRVAEKYLLPERYLYYPAQFWRHKNHLRLLDAFCQVKQEFPDLHLIFTGMKPSGFAEVEAAIEQLGLGACVRHLGYVDYQDLPVIYSLSQMLVMPTLFESISIPIFEAFALQVPVCCSNVVALPEQVGDAGVLFDPLKSEDMAEKIIALLRDEQYRKELGERGFRRLSGFDRIAYARQIQQLSLKVLQ